LDDGLSMREVADIIGIDIRGSMPFCVELDITDNDG
jgi:hypothetical protein